MEVKDCYSDQAELSDIVTEYRNLSYLKIASPVSRIPHLTNADIDHNMPSEFNFNYYSTHDFHSNHDIYESSLDSRSFSALHCNIRSLQGNYYNLAHMLSELQFSFSVIVQQINLIICQEQERPMVYSIFGFKDQKCEIHLGKI